MPKRNYHYSGKSTPEAIAEFNEDFLGQFPPRMRKALIWAMKHGWISTSTRIVCDGCGATTRLVEPKLIEVADGTSLWEGPSPRWVHINRLDFCPKCTLDGSAMRALRDDAKPLGTYTLD